MNELNEVLADAIKKTGGALEKSVDFALAQAPDIIQQAMRWRFTMSLISCVACVLLAGVFLRINLIQLRYWKKVWKSSNLIDHPEIVANFVQIFWLPVFCNLASLEWLKIWIAPKLWLIEYAMSLAKK